MSRKCTPEHTELWAAARELFLELKRQRIPIVSIGTLENAQAIVVHVAELTAELTHRVPTHWQRYPVQLVRSSKVG